MEQEHSALVRTSGWCQHGRSKNLKLEIVGDVMKGFDHYEGIVVQVIEQDLQQHECQHTFTIRPLDSGQTLQ
eukprot:5915497-Amphidinium_carterae.1